MEEGLNKANYYEKILWKLAENIDRTRPCVFLSHKREDKDECKKIAEYLSEANIDYYLDELDLDLQDAARNGDPIKITESIKKGIRESTHMLVVISENTYKSTWVPFEIGYGHSAIIDKGIQDGIKENRIKLAILTLKDISERDLPDYTAVGYIIRGTKSLNSYIAKIKNRSESNLIHEKRIFSNNNIGHSLDSILNWKL